MELSKISGFDTDNMDDKYLRLSDLVEGVPGSKAAYVLDSDARVSRTNSGFAKFFLKDVDANVISAFLFDVKDFVFSGLKLSQFKGKAVMIHFVPQVFNGRYSLIINGKLGIEEYKGEFDRKRFVGEIKYFAGTVIKLGKQVFGEDWELPAEYKICSFDSVGQGKTGAFIKMLEIAANTLVGYKTMLDGSDFGVLLKVFFAVAEAEYKVLGCRQDTEVLEDVSVFAVFESLSRKYREDEYFHIILDAIKGVCGYGGGRSLYSHLVLNAIECAKHSIDLVLSNNTLITGAVASVGDVELLKY